MKKTTSLSTINAQLSNSNQPKLPTKISPLCHVVSANDDNDSDNYFVTRSKARSKANFEAVSLEKRLNINSNFDNNNDLKALLTTEVGESFRQ